MTAADIFVPLSLFYMHSLIYSLYYFIYSFFVIYFIFFNEGVVVYDTLLKMYVCVILFRCTANANYGGEDTVIESVCLASYYFVVLLKQTTEVKTLLLKVYVLRHIISLYC